MKNKVMYFLAAFAVVICSLSCSSGQAYAEADLVYLGGTPLGIGLAEEGLIVTGFVDVITDEGAVCPARGSEILTNDVIVRIDDKEVFEVRDFAAELQNAGSDVTLTVKRGERTFSATLAPVTDSLTGLKRLGLTVKDGINGVGTLTFVTKSHSFGALGHGITDADTGKTFETDSGSIYSCVIKGYKRATEGKAGELIGRFIDKSAPIGKIERCNEYGVYGKAEEGMLAGLPTVAVGGKRDVKPGKAYIYSTIEGSSPQKYEIEIVKTQSQSAPAEKSMLIKVTDRALLEATGGILQGMSGSPIVQNDKLVGAVTHVLINDSTLGYGLYIDWMLRSAA